MNVLYDKNHYKLALGQLRTARHLIDQVAKELGNQRGVWKAEDVPLVVRYLKEQIGRQWPGEFLTSDLMDELAKKDGVDVKWLKSVL